MPTKPQLEKQIKYLNKQIKNQAEMLKLYPDLLEKFKIAQKMLDNIITRGGDINWGASGMPYEHDARIFMISMKKLIKKIGGKKDGKKGRSSKVL